VLLHFIYGDFWSGMQRRVIWNINTDVSEESAIYIFWNIQVTGMKASYVVLVTKFYYKNFIIFGNFRKSVFV